MVRLSLGCLRIEHGETKEASITIDRPFRIIDLYPPSHATKECIGTLGVPPRCACYLTETVAWNVNVGDVFTRENLPVTITCTISAYFERGEFWGERAGEPASEMHVYRYPEIEIEYIEEIEEAKPLLRPPPGVKIIREKPIERKPIRYPEITEEITEEKPLETPTEEIKEEYKCIIASVLFPNSRFLPYLRMFRDRILLKTRLGTELVKLYYRWGTWLMKKLRKL